MAIELYWDNEEKNVMLCEISAPWTWEQLFVMLEKIKKVTDNSTQTIGAILDLSAGVNIPGGSIFNPTVFNYAKKMFQMGEGGTGPIVVVGASPMIRTVYNAALTIDRQKLSNFDFAKTLDEGRALMNTRIQQAVYAPKNAL